MLISHRVSRLTRALDTRDRSDFRILLDQHLVQTARDQRHACVQALLEVGAECRCGNVDIDTAKQAVMNALVSTNLTTRGGEG